ncbi:hypothetical protein [Ancylobacter terrae]|uniref:hypothetical protein n=1 Tax=Ancylobacter sp. sgz301288 TaxID=3342077 RepID=UPI00385CCC34
MLRILIAATMIVALGAGAASAAGRSKDERAAFNQTVHESHQHWKSWFGKSPAPARAPGVPFIKKTPKAGVTTGAGTK